MRNFKQSTCLSDDLRHSFVVDNRLRLALPATWTDWMQTLQHIQACLSHHQTVLWINFWFNFWIVQAAFLRRIFAAVTLCSSGSHLDWLAATPAAPPPLPLLAFPCSPLLLAPANPSPTPRLLMHLYIKKLLNSHHENFIEELFNVQKPSQNCSETQFPTCFKFQPMQCDAPHVTLRQPPHYTYWR